MIYLEKEDNQLTKPFFMSDFKRDDKMKETIYALKKKEKGNLYCDCSGKKVHITIKKISATKRIFITNSKGSGPKHAKHCQLLSGYNPTTEHEPGWTINDEGLIEVNASPSMFKRKKEVNEKPSTYIEKEYSEQKISNTSISRSNLRGLSTKYNMMSSESLSIKKFKDGEPGFSLGEFLTHSYGMSNTIMIKGKNTLFSFLFTNRNNPKVSNKSGLYYIYFPLKSVRTKKYNKTTLILDANMSQEKEWLTSFDCPDYLFEAAKKKNIMKIEGKNEDGSYNILVAGFVKKREYGFEFESIELLPITKQGVWVESGKEKQVFESFFRDDISFFKGYEPLEYYNNQVPDIIFNKRLNPDIPYIGEVFGRENDADYTRKKLAKIELARTSADFDFWSIDANRNRLDTFSPVYLS